MKKILSSLVIVLLIMCFILPKNTSLADENVVKIEVISSTNELIPGSEVELKVNLANTPKGIDTLIGLIDYDRQIFEEITEDELVPVGKWSYPFFNQKDGLFMIERNGLAESAEEIMTIKLKVKSNVTASQTTLKILDLEAAGLGEDLPVQANDSILGTTVEVAKQQYSIKIEELTQDGQATVDSKSQYTLKMPDGTFKILSSNNNEIVIPEINCPEDETIKAVYEIRQTINSQGKPVLEELIKLEVSFAKDEKISVSKATATGENVVKVETTQELVTLTLKDGNKTSGAGEELYLKSDVYKIGEEKINEYNKGDIYISRLDSGTKIADFIARCSTNGQIKVLKTDGKELGKDELIGTGMVLKVNKDNQEITLTIVVKCDLDGNGKVTATDLSKLNQSIVGITQLEGAYFKAADTDENQKVTVTDLSTLNKVLVQ